ncbi:MAG: hypothetical protein F4X31_09835 [Gammaproteobacteria bacterium]|nr:hypothetical protein [Gammaproteobacteria bacterium]
MATVDFIYGLGSRYSYLASTQIERIARETGALGLDLARFESDLDSPELAQEHEQRVLEAESRGAFGVPTFLYGDDLYWGNDRLVLLEAALGAKHAPVGEGPARNC